LKLLASQPIQASDSWQRWKRWAKRPTPTILCRWVRNEDYRILCVDHQAEYFIQYGTFPRYQFVTPEAKIRQLCTRLLAAVKDEGSKRILHELREAPSQKPRKLKQEVAREMEREYRLHEDDMAAD
jgi:hypothetical protein